MKKLQKSIITTVALGALVFGLSGCSGHTNPLYQPKHKKDVAKFLVAASQYAEKQQHIFQAPGGYVYGDCMTGKGKPGICKAVYQSMTVYAEHQSEYPGLTVSNLKDQKMWRLIQADYQRERFDAI